MRPVVGEKLPYTNNLPIIEQERPENPIHAKKAELEKKVKET